MGDLSGFPLSRWDLSCRRMWRSTGARSKGAEQRAQPSRPAWLGLRGAGTGVPDDMLSRRLVEGVEVLRPAEQEALPNTPEGNASSCSSVSMPSTTQDSPAGRRGS